MEKKTFYVFNHSSSIPHLSNVPNHPNFYVSESSEAFRNLPIETINWSLTVSADNANQAVTLACDSQRQRQRQFRP